MIVGRIRQYKTRQDVSSRHVYSVIETRQSKATTPKDNSFFLKRKGKAASGGMHVYCLVLTFSINLMDAKSGPVWKTLNIMDALFLEGI